MSLFRDLFSTKKLDERENTEANSIYSESLGLILIISIILIMVYDTLNAHTVFFNFLSPRYFIIYPSLVVAFVTTYRLSKIGIIDKLCAIFTIFLFPMYTVFGLVDILQVKFTKGTIIFVVQFPIVAIVTLLTYLWFNRIYLLGKTK